MITALVLAAWLVAGIAVAGLFYLARDKDDNDN